MPQYSFYSLPENAKDMSLNLNFHEVQVEKVSHLSDSEVFQHVLQSVERSRVVWLESTSGELAEMTREAEQLTDPAIIEDNTLAQIAKSAPQYGAILGLSNMVESLKHGRHPELLSRLEDILLFN
jgi:hypothetical protein